MNVDAIDNNVPCLILSQLKFRFTHVILLRFFPFQSNGQRSCSSSLFCSLNEYFIHFINVTGDSSVILTI